MSLPLRIEPVVEGDTKRTAFSPEIYLPLCVLANSIQKIRGQNCDVYRSEGRLVWDLVNSTTNGGPSNPAGEFPPYGPPPYFPPPYGPYGSSGAIYHVATYSYKVGYSVCEHRRDWTKLTYSGSFVEGPTTGGRHQVADSGQYRYQSFLSMAYPAADYGDDGACFLSRYFQSRNDDLSRNWEIQLSRFNGKVTSVQNYILTAGNWIEDRSMNGRLWHDDVGNVITSSASSPTFALSTLNPISIGSFTPVKRLSNAMDEDWVNSWEHNPSFNYYPIDVENGTYSIDTSSTTGTFYYLVGDGTYTWPSGVISNVYYYSDLYIFRQNTQYSTTQFKQDAKDLLTGTTKTLTSAKLTTATGSYSDAAGTISISSSNVSSSEANAQSTIIAYRFHQQASGPVSTGNVWTDGALGLPERPLRIQLKNAQALATPSIASTSHTTNQLTVHFNITSLSGSGVLSIAIDHVDGLHSSADTVNGYAVTSATGSGCIVRFTTWINTGSGYYPTACVKGASGSGYVLGTAGDPSTTFPSWEEWFIAHTKRWLVYTWSVPEGAKIRASGDMPACSTALSVVEADFESLQTVSEPNIPGWRQLVVKDMYSFTGGVYVQDTTATESFAWPTAPSPTQTTWETQGGTNPARYTGGIGTALTWYVDEPNLKFKIYRNTVNTFGTATLLTGTYTQNPARRLVSSVEDGNYVFTYTDATAGSSGLYYWIVAWFNTGVETTSASRLST